MYDYLDWEAEAREIEFEQESDLWEGMFFEVGNEELIHDEQRTSESN